ncbi:hypothetical protein ACFQRB_09530 [Halobaculum litoreum]|uniref:Uncharacterized protein n=1 Tax=Halobaculum litoreum TaxID=3031998 RepID=A0ABD5XXB6_9EURY
MTVAGVVSPDRLLALDAAALRDAARANVTVSAGGDRWTVGPPRPSAPGTSDRSLSGVARSERRVGVALGPGRVRPGRLAVTVWG